MLQNSSSTSNRLFGSIRRRSRSFKAERFSSSGKLSFDYCNSSQSKIIMIFLGLYFRLFQSLKQSASLRHVVLDQKLVLSSYVHMPCHLKPPIQDPCMLFPAI